MLYPFKSSFSRAVTLLGLLGLGFMQVGCAHPVVVEPSVSVSSRIGHFPVYAQVGVPGPMVVMPQAPVYYAPPPPRVIYAPQVYGPAYGWRSGHEHRSWGHERRHPHHDGGWGNRGNGRR